MCCKPAKESGAARYRRQKAERAALAEANRRTKSVYNSLMAKNRTVEIPARWEKHYWNFLEDVGIRPEGTGLRRKNNNLPHSAENSYWGPLIKGPDTFNYKGQEITFKEAVAISGLPESTLWNRLVRRASKWTVESAIDTPAQARIPGGNPNRRPNGRPQGFQKGNQAHFLHGYARKGQLHPLFKRWKDFKRNGGTDERWANFENFMEDIAARPGGDKVYLRRIEKSKPWSKDNTEWVSNYRFPPKEASPVEAGDLQV